ncbi:MAG: NADH-quinone oxidoreductase subunit F [Candidatus Cloacimonetes bacterium]|nr:NADH-quinone oxidoreductase subunit F [Candidatus Cloacimonadota bacterium]
MVEPIYLFIILPVAAFLMGSLHQHLNRWQVFIFFTVLLFSFYLPIPWLIHLLKGGSTAQVFTAGFLPPISINLQIGIEEAFLMTIINLLGIMGAFYLLHHFRGTVYGPILYLVFIMGLNGIIMTRDLFNLFVFMEITSISLYSLITLSGSSENLTAGFKYIIASGIASILFLIGTIYLYYLTGTLNIDVMIASGYKIVGPAGSIALIMLLSAIIVELKQFPVNGWALDIYTASDPGIAAIIAGGSSSAMFFAAYKLLPLWSPSLSSIIAGIGIMTYVLMNLMGLKQVKANRLLGYSSIAQIGLLVGLSALLLHSTPVTGLTTIWIILGGLLINHLLAKAGLFWISGLIKGESLSSWSVLRKYPSLLFIFACLLMALAGLPPFPGFWVKWNIAMQLAQHKQFLWLGFIMLGTLLEAVYFFRWFGLIMKSELTTGIRVRISSLLPIFTGTFLMFFISLTMMNLLSGFNFNMLLPILIATLIFALKLIPGKLKALMTIFIIMFYFYFLLPELSGLYRLFAIIFFPLSALFMIAAMNKPGYRNGYFELLILIVLSLGNLLTSHTSLQFFYSWEVITVATYLIILRGVKRFDTALLYLVFSLAGALMILAGFSYSYAVTGSTFLGILGSSNSQITIYILLVGGFLIKTGAVGVHIWLPGAYAETEDDFSPIISAILSKTGILGLLLVLLLMGKSFAANTELNTILGWIGVLTAFLGALFAIFQEDLKYMLAYSSMGQVGYIVLALALYSHLGWTAALYLAFNHIFFKGILFLAAAGIIQRLGTRKMYEMGGLINRMPLSFLAVLISIIALSGVPPLSGFGSKWLLYNALLEKEWYLQAALAFFASTVAFLYCFRLIHSIFLGQEKTRFRQVKEASLWFLIPQYVLIALIMLISLFPNIIIEPIAQVMADFIPATLSWEGNTLMSSLGYWNGNVIMIITMGVFMIPLIGLLLRVRSMQKVKQFNIVYAAERPDKPETTHVAHNFFPHYQKALGFLVTPLVSKFWAAVSEWCHTIAGVLRNIYTGNGQTYALHIVFMVVLIYILAGV